MKLSKVVIRTVGVYLLKLAYDRYFASSGAAARPVPADRHPAYDKNAEDEVAGPLGEV